MTKKEEGNFLEAFGAKLPINETAFKNSETLKVSFSNKFKTTNIFEINFSDEFKSGFEYVYNIMSNPGLGPDNVLTAAAIADYLNVDKAKQEIKTYLLQNVGWFQKVTPFVFYKFVWLREIMKLYISQITPDYNKLPINVLNDYKQTGIKDFNKNVYVELKTVILEEVPTVDTYYRNYEAGYILAKGKEMANIKIVTINSIYYFSQSGNKEKKTLRYGTDNTEISSFRQTNEGYLIIVGNKYKNRNFFYGKLKKFAVGDGKTIFITNDVIINNLKLPIPLVYSPAAKRQYLIKPIPLELSVFGSPPPIQPVFGSQPIINYGNLVPGFTGTNIDYIDNDGYVHF